MACAKVDATKGQVGVSAVSRGTLTLDGQITNSKATASGMITDILVFSDSTFTINTALSGSMSRTITGNATGDAKLFMNVSLYVFDPIDPFDPFVLIYSATLTRLFNFQGRPWSIASTESGFKSGKSNPRLPLPPLQLSDTFILPSQFVGGPVFLEMQVLASSQCKQNSGSCFTRAQAFETGHLGITGTYTSTHSYPGFQASAVPEPQSVLLFGIGLAALIGGSFRRLAG